MGTAFFVLGDRCKSPSALFHLRCSICAFLLDVRLVRHRCECLMRLASGAFSTSLCLSQIIQIMCLKQVLQQTPRLPLMLTGEPDKAQS